MPKEKFWASSKRIIELLTQRFVIKLSKIWVLNPGSEIRKKPIPDPGSGSRGQKRTGSRNPESGSATLAKTTKF
jgi:hypothetical protein